MKSHHELTLETLKGCGEEFDDNEYPNLATFCGESYSTWNKKLLCPICKAKAQILLDAGKDELEFLNNLVGKVNSIYDFEEEKYGKVYDHTREILIIIKERITQLSQDIKLLEENL